MKQIISVLCLVAFIGVAGAQDKTVSAKKDTTTTLKSTPGCYGGECTCGKECMEKCGKKMGDGSAMKSDKKMGHSSHMMSEKKMGNCSQMKSEKKTESSEKLSPDSSVPK